MFTALLYDYKGNYEIAFILAGIPPIIGAFIMIFVPRKVSEDQYDGIAIYSIYMVHHLRICF